MTKILVSAPYMLAVIDRFLPQLESAGLKVELADVNERLSEGELLALIGDVDGVICGDDAFTERVMEQAPLLRVISKWGTGIDSIDEAAADRRGIRVCNTPNAFTDSVADTAMGYVLVFARQLVRSDTDIRDGAWRKRPVVALCECTLGIVGLGNIGLAVAKRARAFGMTVIGTDIDEQAGQRASEVGVAVRSLEELLKQSDYVTLHCDLNPTSFHLMGDDNIALMKPSAYLVNTARGPMVEEQSLVSALERNAIAGAALDVFEEEPLPLESRLREFSNCLFAPHNANGSPSAAEKVHISTITNLLKGLAELPPRTR
jgi:D-3-phosphoglycerate dehydrogenase